MFDASFKEFQQLKVPRNIRSRGGIPLKNKEAGHREQESAEKTKLQRDLADCRVIRDEPDNKLTGLKIKERSILNTSTTERKHKHNFWGRCEKRDWFQIYWM